MQGSAVHPLSQKSKAAGRGGRTLPPHDLGLFDPQPAFQQLGEFRRPYLLQCRRTGHVRGHASARRQRGG